MNLDTSFFCELNEAITRVSNTWRSRIGNDGHGEAAALQSIQQLDCTIKLTVIVIGNQIFAVNAKMSQ
jgi:hypothetical protein